MITRIRNLVAAQMLPKNLRISAILVAIYQVVSFQSTLHLNEEINKNFVVDCTFFDVCDAFGIGAC